MVFKLLAGDLAPTEMFENDKDAKERALKLITSLFKVNIDNKRNFKRFGMLPYDYEASLKKDESIDDEGDPAKEKLKNEIWKKIF